MLVTVAFCEVPSAKCNLERYSSWVRKNHGLGRIKTGRRTSTKDRRAS